MSRKKSEAAKIGNAFARIASMSEAVKSARKRLLEDSEIRQHQYVSLGVGAEGKRLLEMSLHIKKQYDELN